MALSQKRRAEFAAVRTLPARPATASQVSVMVNAGLPRTPRRSPMTGADGIGLFRTEFQFLVSATLPGRDRQQRLYTKVLEAAGDRPVVFRTVDIGGDKALPYLTDEAEEQAENPAMGWRALRLSLDRSTLMKAQARALIEASAGKVLRVMFPMVSEPWEYEEARALFEEQVDWARKGHRKLPTRIEFGAMLEVPSLAEMLDQLLPRVDFISIGTNDLTQFLFAADRSDPRLAQRYDWLSPAILRFLKRVLDAGARGRRARAHLRRNGRAAARGDGADRARRRKFLDHAGGRRAGQGDGPLARRGGDPRAARPAARQAAARTCARRSASGRGGISRSSDMAVDTAPPALKQETMAKRDVEAEPLDEEPVEADAPTVGERLRAAREEKKLSLEDVAAQTRIPQRHLESIETRRVGQSSRADLHLGFAKSYASAVGLDRAEIGDQLREEMGGQRFASTSQPTCSSPPTRARTMPKWLVIGAIVAVIVLIVVMSLLNRRSLDSRETRRTMRRLRSRACRAAQPGAPAPAAPPRRARWSSPRPRPLVQVTDQGRDPVRGHAPAGPDLRGPPTATAPCSRPASPRR